MRGHLIIAKHHAFYNIKNDLKEVNIKGNNNKVDNPFRITNLFIQGNNNNVEIRDNGRINNINIVGNNNKIHIKNNSYSKYLDQGIGNKIIRHPPPLIPSYLGGPINLYGNSNINFINHINQMNINNNIDNRVNIYMNSLEEKDYLGIPNFIKTVNLNKCSLCNKVFLDLDRVKLFSCKIHIFHSQCLENWIRTNINSIKCPKCGNNNNDIFIPPAPLNINNFNQNRLRFRLNQNDDHSNSMSMNDEDNDGLGDSYEELNMEHDFDNENFEDDLDDMLMDQRGLDKNILDNMEISKIQNIDKLDNDKKKCTICLENYAIGDDSIALPCIHIFHANCVKTWLKNHNTCPICKIEIKYEMEDIYNDEYM